MFFNSKKKKSTFFRFSLKDKIKDYFSKSQKDPSFYELEKLFYETDLGVNFSL